MNNINQENPSGASFASELVDHAGLALPDNRAVDLPLRASVLIALRVYNTQILEGQLRQHIAQALRAQTVGQVRKVIAAVDRLLHK